MSQTRRMGLLRPDVGESDHVAGPASAPVTLVEYGDFECPWCFRAHPVVQMLQGRFGDRLRFVFRNFPLTELHPRAHRAAEAAESVGAANGPEAYWRMHDLIYKHQQDSADALDDAHLLQYAKSAGGDPEQVRRDWESGKFVERVDADFMSGVRSGVNGTPTFFINGQRFDGDWTHTKNLSDAIEDSLKSGKP